MHFGPRFISSINHIDTVYLNVGTCIAEDCIESRKLCMIVSSQASLTRSFVSRPARGPAHV